MKYEDLSGRVFGRLTAIEFVGRKGEKRGSYWRCNCSCGNEKITEAYALKSGGAKSCGCYKDERNREFEDLSGKCYGRLKVIKVSTKRLCNEISWCCKCSCGKKLIVRGHSLKTGHTKSCGCFHRNKSASQAYAMGKANTRHGMTHTREYELWHHMRQRCLDPNCPGYEYYGGRGIKICARWGVFENFFADMGKRPSEEHQIDRIDYDGHYEPNNCRWVTPTEQQRNRSSNVLVTHNGKTQCISAWAEEYGLTILQLHTRLRELNWPIHEALNLPIATTVSQKKQYKQYRNKGPSELALIG